MHIHSYIALFELRRATIKSIQWVQYYLIELQLQKDGLLSLCVVLSPCPSIKPPLYLRIFLAPEPQSRGSCDSSENLLELKQTLLVHIMYSSLSFIIDDSRSMPSNVFSATVEWQLLQALSNDYKTESIPQPGDGVMGQNHRAKQQSTV